MEEPRLKKIEATAGGGLKISMAPGELLQHFVAEMKENLKAHDAPNYVETEFVDLKTGERFTLLIQRVEGITPGQAADLEKLRANRAEAEIERLTGLLRRCLTPLRFASTRYLNEGMLPSEDKTDALIASITKALKG